MIIPESELIINADGSAFHLHVKPGQLAEKIILVGDRKRVDSVASFFDEVHCDVQNREFHTITGSYKGKAVSVISTGIGVGNIDIVVNEIDAIFNIDFETRCVKDVRTAVDLVRIGTSGGLQEFTPEGTFVASESSMGLDNLLYFYGDSKNVRNLKMEKAFADFAQTLELLESVKPYCVNSSAELLDRIAKDDVIKGITITAPGFYAPQGRQLRYELTSPSLIDVIRNFAFNDMKLCNFEMESSALAGLSAMLGHKALTICLIIANRYGKRFIGDYSDKMNELIELVLNRI